MNGKQKKREIGLTTNETHIQTQRLFASSIFQEAV